MKRAALPVAAAVLIAGCAPSPPASSDGPTVFDFREHSMPFRVLAAGGAVDVGNPHYRAHLHTGWSWDEGRGDTPAATWAWVEGTSAAADVVVGGGRPDELRFRAWAGPGPSPRRVRVLLNDEEVGAVDVRPESSEFGIRTGKAPWVAGLNRVEFLVDGAESPSDLGLGDDRRELSIAVQEIRAGRDDGTPSVQLAHSLLLPREPRLVLRGAPEEGAADFAVRVRGAGEGADATVAEFRWTGPDSSVVDLGAFAGGRVELSLAMPGGERSVRWEEMRIVGDPEGRDVRTNVLLIVIDTLRADALAAYGGLAATPVLDRLARGGTLFSRAYSHVPITGPSHASLFTSQYPVDHRVENNVQKLDGTYRTMAEVLRDSWRSTVAFVSLGVLRAQFGFGRGFDHYADTFHGDWWKDADEINEEAFAWLDRRGDAPFFLFLHYSDPHEPYAAPTRAVPAIRARDAGRDLGAIVADGTRDRWTLDASGERSLSVRSERSGRFVFREIQTSPGVALVPPPEFRERQTIVGKEYVGTLPATFSVTGSKPGAWVSLRVLEDLSRDEIRDRYREEVEFVDREIGRVVDELELRGLLDSTLVIVTSDHGEGLGDHGLIGHIDQLYDSALRVPLILRMPGRVPAGLGPRVARHIDVLPTLTELLRLEAPAGIRGRTLLSPVPDGAPADSPAVGFTYRPEAASDRRSVVVSGHKYIVDLDDGTEEFYRLDDDPGERAALTDASSLLERARETLEEQTVSGREDEATVEAAISDEERDRLRALGYAH